jgi:hypothetical protein
MFGQKNQTIEDGMVYKYFRKLARNEGDPKGLLECITKQEILLSPPSKYNDPFDSQIYLQDRIHKSLLLKFFDKHGHSEYMGYSREELYSASIEEGHFSKDTKGYILANETFVDGIRDGIKDKLKLACYSASCDNILLWTHYASNHEGVCLGFKKHKKGKLLGLIFNGVEINTKNHKPLMIVHPLKKVKYTNKMLQVPWFVHENEKFIEIIMKAITRKSTQWKYEEEYRALFVSSFLGKGASRVIFPKQELKEVIFGVRTSEQDKKEIKQLLEDSGFSDIDILQVSPSRNRFVLEVRAENCDRRNICSEKCE